MDERIWAVDGSGRMGQKNRQMFGPMDVDM
jgi:hypothetical protein